VPQPASNTRMPGRRSSSATTFGRACLGKAQARPRSRSKAAYRFHNTAAAYPSCADARRIARTGTGRVPKRPRQDALAQCAFRPCPPRPRRQDFLDSLPFVTNLGTTKGLQDGYQNYSKTAPSKNSTPAAPTAKATSPYKPTQERDRRPRLRDLSARRRNDHENWLRAERELMARGRR